MVVLITGAGSGIGAATARLFDKSNYEVILVGRDREKLLTVAKSLKNVNIEICDLQNSKSISALAKKTKHLDVLINNAGIIERKSFEDSAPEDWAKQFQTNCFGPAELTRMFLPKLKKSKGCIINIASTLGCRPVALTSVYSSSKAAMISWTQTLALEVAADGVRVNSISPGIVNTPILTPNQKKLSKSDETKLGDLHPLGRLGKPEEIAEAAFYLSHAKWVTGTNLIVDGGISLTQN